MKRALITGSNGFIGIHLIDAFSRAGFEVLAGIRAHSKAGVLSQKPCQVHALDYLNAKKLKLSIDELQPDVVVHCAGVTVAGKPEAYHQGNVLPTENLLRALAGTSTKFILLSSLAARGPGVTSVDQPWSEYGRSKLVAEGLVKASGLDWSIIRPTAVYGPGDKAFEPLFAWARQGVYISLGSAKRNLTFVHVTDVCRLVLESVEHQNTVMYAWDGNNYEQHEVVKAFRFASKKSGISLGIPSWTFRAVTSPADVLIRRILRLPWAYPPEKLKELLADDWGIPDEEKLSWDTIDLKSGFVETYKSYFPSIS